ncbi:MAG: DUF4007 family protein [Phycisphaerales bacterium]|nr:MAG: DUF4007 family protein [Phycisphaerales bacterium]
MLEAATIQLVRFSGHESFPLRFAWLAKAVRACSETAHQDVFVRDDAVVTLGVGKNMVRSMRHWALRSGMIQPADDSKRGGRYEPSPLGQYLFGFDGVDPYLEDPATTWLVHWGLCSDANESPTTWFYLFNLLREQSFTVPEAVECLLRFAEPASGKRANRNTVERDMHCFVRTYSRYEPDRKISREETFDSPLSELNLIRQAHESDRILIERSERPTLPPAVFAYALLEYWRRQDTAAHTLSFEQIAYGPGGPGQVFKLSENSVVDLLDAIPATTGGAVSFDSTSGLRQVLRHKLVPDQLSVLARHYGDHAAAGVNSAAK